MLRPELDNEHITLRTLLMVVVLLPLNVFVMLPCSPLNQNTLMKDLRTEIRLGIVGLHTMINHASSAFARA